MPKQKRIAFVADAPEKFDPDAETTLFLMREVERRGGEVFLCQPKDLFLKQGVCWGDFGGQKIALKKFTAVFLRKDPPFDQAYLYHLWLLAKVTGKVSMINEPEAILRINEKLSPLDFPFTPKTWVGSRADLLRDWGRSLKNGIVIKPLNESGGRGVRLLRPKDLAHLRLKKTMVAQEYLPEAKKGDVRILLWNGKILGSFRRIPKKGDFRANLHAGGRFAPHRITAPQEKIARHLGKWCKNRGLYFVGLDLIGNKVTEINVTSPMGIREVNELYGLRVERKIVRDVFSGRLFWI